MELKVISWNIWIDGHFDEWKEFLSAANADIIGLQEVKDDDSERNIIDLLNGFGYMHTYAPIDHVWDGKKYRNGPAIFSKHEIVSSAVHKLSVNDSRHAVQADVRVEGKLLHIFSTHLTHTHQKQSDTQEEQIMDLIKVLPGEHTIVMGDFNATPESEAYKKITSVLKDTDSSSAPTWSVYPEGCGVCKPQKLDTRLDYIFVSPNIQFHSFKVGDSKGSDHLPVSVQVEL